MHLIWNTVPSLPHLRETSRIKNWSQNFFIRILTSFEKFPTFPKRSTSWYSFHGIPTKIMCMFSMQANSSRRLWVVRIHQTLRETSFNRVKKRAKKKKAPPTAPNLCSERKRPESDSDDADEGLFIDSSAEDRNIWRKNRTRTELICSDFDAMWWTMWVWQC